MSVLVWLFLCCYSVPVSAQQSSTNAEIIRQAITDLKPVAGKTPSPLSLSRNVQIAIAFQEGKSWNSPEAEQFRKLLSVDKQKLLWDSLRKLIEDGDIATAGDIYNSLKNPFPPQSEVSKARELLKNAGLRIAYDVISLSCDSDPKVIIASFCNISAEKRAPVEDFLYSRFHPSHNPMNSIMLYSNVMSMYAAVDPQKDPQSADGILRFADLYGFPNYQFTEFSVSDVYSKGNY